MANDMETMVLISAPPDFASWPRDQKLDRYERVVEWHEYARRLNRLGKLTHAWGSHQLLSRAQLSPSQGVLLAVYRTSCWQEFDDLFLQDPLRDISHYSTPALTALLEDKESDQQRYEDHKNMFFANKDASFVQRFDELRAMSNQPPSYFGALDYQKPTNRPTDFDRGFRQGDPLQVFLQGVNPPEYITLWDDAKKLIHHEKVMWWHDYMAKMISEQKVSHAWGTSDFCYDSGVSGNSASAVAIYSVKDYEEFNHLYSLDPIRRDTVFWSILLQPIADQRRLDTERLKRETAKTRPRSNLA